MYSLTPHSTLSTQLIEYNIHTFNSIRSIHSPNSIHKVLIYSTR